MPTGDLKFYERRVVERRDTRHHSLKLVQRVVKTLRQKRFFISKVVVKGTFGDLQLFGNFIE